jgi:hypothetical protein
MPQVAVVAAAYFASTAVEAAFIFTGVSATTISVVSAAAGAAVLVGGSALLARDPELPSQQRTSVIRQAAAPRRLIYGEVQAGGVLACPPLASTSNRKLANLVIMLGDGPIESVDAAFWIGELPSTDSRFDGLVQTSWNLGTDDQPALASMIAERADVWTTDHRLAGIAHGHIRLEWDANAFPQGLPNLRFLVRGRLLYDPRTSTTAWSNNPALVMLDYLRSPLGLRCPDELIDFDAFSTAASVCDEAVASADTANEVDGLPGYVKRYTFDGVIDLSAGRASILESIEQACAGKLTFSAGQYRLHVGAYAEPHELTLTEGMLRAPFTFRPQPTRQTLCNLITGTYIEPRQDWQDVDYEPQRDEDAITADGDEIVQAQAYKYTTTGAIAQRLARQALRKVRNSATLSVQCNWAALSYRIMDVVRVDLPEAGIEGDTYRVIGWSIAEGGGVDLSLSRESADDYAWTAADEVLVQDVVKPDSGTSSAPDAVTSLAVSGAPRLADYGTVPLLSATWDAIEDFGEPSYEVQWKLSTDAEYNRGETVTTTQWETLSVVADTEYDVRVRAVMGGTLRKSEWAEVLATLVQNDTSAPGVPTSLSVTGSGLLTIGWTTPSSDDFKTSRVYINTSATPVGATLLQSINGLASTAYTTTHTPGATRYYYVAAVDRTGNESALTYAGSGS